MNPPLLRDGRLLLYLFVGLRLMLALIYQPYMIGNVERGLSTFGDERYYFSMFSLSDQGKLPYRDYWFEFPPVFAIVGHIAYGLSAAHGAGDFTVYATVMGLLMTAFDVGNLLLIMRIGRRIHGESVGIALGWIYGLCTALMVFSWWGFEPMVAFWVLLSIAFLVERRDIPSALATALGALTKLFPLIVIGVAVRFRSLRELARYGAVALGITAIGLLGMLFFAGSRTGSLGGEFGVASLISQWNKPSYETVWALIDQNYRTGIFGSVENHLSAANAYNPGSLVSSNPAVIPSWLRIIVFGAIGLFVFAQTRRFDNRGMVAFASITVTLFFLWAQGWSPQWQVVLIPLILLNFPNRSGILAGLLLSLVSFAEYPALFERTGDTGGAISPAQLPLYTALIVTRTAILIGFAAALYRQLRVPAESKPLQRPSAAVGNET
jgi:hypothetical protein